MMEQQQLLSQARKMESAARDIRTQMKEIAASGLTIPSSTLLKKAIISVKNGKVMFCIEQLSKVVNLLMGNLPHILFRPKSDTKGTSSCCSGLPTWTILNVKFRKNSKLSSKKSLSITFNFAALWKTYRLRDVNFYT